MDIRSLSIKMKKIEKLYKDIMSTRIDNMIPDWEYLEILYRYTLKWKPSLVLETGTYAGKSAIAIATGMRENGNRGKVITIDNRRYDISWPGRSKFAKGAVDLALERFDRLGFNNIDFIECDCLKPPKYITNKRYDFVFLDSAHTYNHVAIELEVYAGLTKRIFIHDIGKSSDGGGGRALLNFLKFNSNWEATNLGTRFGLWLIERKY